MFMGYVFPVLLDNFSVCMCVSSTDKSCTCILLFWVKFEQTLFHSHVAWLSLAENKYTVLCVLLVLITSEVCLDYNLWSR